MELIQAFEKEFNGLPTIFYRAESFPTQPDAFPTHPDVFHIQDDLLWATGDEIGRALGFATPRESINKLWQRNRDFLEPFTTLMEAIVEDGSLEVKLTPSPDDFDEISTGKKRPIRRRCEIRFFNETGAHIIAVKANTPRAKEYILWLGKLASDYRKGLLRRDGSEVEGRGTSALPSAEQIREMRMTLEPSQARVLLARLIEATIPKPQLSQGASPADRLRALMGQARLSARKLADLAGVSYRTIYYQLEPGSVHFAHNEIQSRIAAALHVTPADIWPTGQACRACQRSRVVEAAGLPALTSGEGNIE